MAVVVRLALGVFLCFPGCLTISVFEVNVSLAATKGYIISKCGCSDLECSLSDDNNSQGFEISKSGNIILATDAINFKQQIHSVLVNVHGNCYFNMDKVQKFIFSFVDSSSAVSMNGALLHSSMLNDSPALVGTVASLAPFASEKDQIQTFSLLGPWSEHFKVKVNDANEVHIVKEPKFLQDESFATLLFILELKSEHQTRYYNIEVFIGFDVEDSENLFWLEQESHSVEKRQLSTTIPTTMPPKNISVYENNTGVLFNILDGQSPTNRLSFEITKATPENIFLILDDGNVTLKEGSHLDYEKGHRMYTLLIDARSTTQVPSATHYSVNLEVLDSNDEPPVFLNQPRPFLATLQRESPLGTVVYILNASDPDPGSSLRFYKNGSLDFDVNENTGEITTTRSFNGVNDTVGTDYVISVYVSDIAAPILQTTEATVTVRIGSRGPQFYSPSYSASLRDDNDINLVVPVLDENGAPSPVKSLNFQADMTGVTTYSVYDSVTTVSDKFAISPEGNLKVLKKLLLGVDPPDYSLFLQATDSASGLSTQVNLTVHLLKNLKPVFTLPVYTQTVLENLKINDTVLTVETIATNNSQQFNFSVDSSVFWVENSNGKGIIRVRSPLDYEAESDSNYQDHSYTFNVTIVGYNMTSLVVVYIKNVNDEPPFFTSRSEVTMQDSIQSGRIVMNVKAIDKDGDKVTYKFQGSSSEFQIDQNSGQITSRMRPDKDFYQLTVIAEDDGSCCNYPHRSQHHQTTQEIRINVVDSINYKPQFVDCSSYYNASILEEEPRGTVVLTVSATDSNKGENGVVDYTILSFRDDLTQDFFIEKVNDSGVIRSNVKFDRETLKDILKVTVIATDHGQPPLSSECSFIVDVIDINDNAPEFLSGENVQGCDMRDIGSVSRDSSVGDVALNIRAFDIDLGENAQVVYSLLDNPGNYFGILTDSGIISVNGNLSDAPESVTLQVLASDKGEIPQNTTTSVVIDINNFTTTKIWPSDKNNPDLVINDNTRTDALITSVQFGSVITGAKLIVKCQSSDQTDKFKISVPADDNKRFNLNAAGDFDDEKGTKVVQIRVYKGLGSAQSYEDSFFLFHINDTNNKVPKFVNRENPKIGKIEFSVQEEQDINEEVGILLAHDEDSNPLFNKVTYKTRFNDTNFKVNDLSGVVSTLIRFDRENLTSDVIDMQVIAEDGFPSSIPGKNGPNIGTKVVQITIEDINDNRPYFASNSYFFTIPENAPIYQPVGTIKALDKDSEKTSQYTKYSVGDSKYFGVDENNGEIFVAGILLGQANKNFSITFMADDGKFAESVPVQIGVQRTYNRRPEFSGNYDIQNIVANRNYNESLFQVKATDPDCGDPCTLTYGLVWGDPVIPRVFSIDHSTGEVFLLAPLEPRPYVFSVKVTDTSSPGRRKKRSLAAKDAYTTVTIQPANCNAHQVATEAGVCECIDYCKNGHLCLNGATCQLNCTSGSQRGYSCVCPPGYSGWDCGGIVAVTSAPRNEDRDDNTWLIVLLVVIAVIFVVVILVVAFIIMRRKRVDKDKSMFAYDNDDYDIREDVMDYDEDGAGEDDYAGYDITMIRKPVAARVTREDTTVPRSRTTSDKPNTSSGPSTGHLGEFINERLGDAEGDSGAPPYDTLHEFMYEGEGSLAGSLSSINTSSSGGSQDYEYLNEWGPKFAKLADMYNTYEDSD